LVPDELSRWMNRLQAKARKTTVNQITQEHAQAAGKFVPVQITPSTQKQALLNRRPRASTSPLTIDFSNGLRLCLTNDFDAKALARVLDIMERRSC
jgi:hypothetical protein